MVKVTSLRLRYIASKEQPADLPTKNLDVILTRKFGEIIFGVECAC